MTVRLLYLCCVMVGVLAAVCFRVGIRVITDVPAFGVRDDAVCEQSVGGGAVRSLWSVHVFARVVISSVGFMLELVGIRWVCAV